MTNGERGGGLADELLRAIAREYGWPAYKPVERTVVPVPASELALLTGRYEMRPGKVFAIALDGEKLYHQGGGMEDRALPRVADPLLRAGRGAYHRLREGRRGEADRSGHRRPDQGSEDRG
ncbi:MAG: hypothetical protein MZV63_40315 [Marinilabiliales bacterium]|nr:hypothetical protein [Marinilabiliales bacterium]